MASQWEPYVRIWKEARTLPHVHLEIDCHCPKESHEVAMLAARDYRQLCKVVHAAIEFSRWQERGQPGTPDTLYPMTYGQLDEWHAKWDELYAALRQSVAEMRTVHEEASTPS